jgi:hypothetical protein
MKNVQSYESFINESIATNYSNIWKEFDVWVKENKYPAWMHQKRKLMELAQLHNVIISKPKWSKIWSRYDMLQKKDYFQAGWEFAGIPWLEKQFDKLK